MKGKITGKLGSERYFLDGKEVSKKEFDRAFPDQALDVAPSCVSCSAWPLISDGAGVHPKQRAEAEALARKLGVPTEFTSAGSAVFRDRDHRKRFLKAHHMRDNDGGYGD